MSVIGDHAALLDRWFEEEIRPLYNRHQELASESLSRKIGALREAVETTLRTKLERAGRTSQAEAVAARKIESQLRRAGGKLQQTRKLCEKLADEIADCTDVILAAAALRLIEGSGPAPEETVRVALVGVTAEKAKAIREEMQTLAEEVTGALDVAATSLGTAGPAPDEELESMIREMPRPDLGEIRVEVRPSVLSRLSKDWESRRMQSKMREQVGSQLDTALSAYSHLLESWSRKTIAELQRRFDTQADSYRTQLGRLAGAGESSIAAPDAIRRDLELLQAPVPAESHG